MHRRFKQALTLYSPSAAYDAKQNGDNGNNKQYMNKPANVIADESDCPANN